MLSIYNSLTGAEAAVLKAGTTIGGRTYDDANKLTVIAPATTTLTLTQALHSGKILLVASTGGLAVTPPAATGTGAEYRFVFTATITGGSFTFDPKAGNAADLLVGLAFQMKVGTGLSVYANAANTNFVTLTGSTTGGIAGDYLELIDVATNQWLCRLCGQATGTVATPFSNH